MTKRWDVVVIGAGPAGSATALLLARAGAQVLLVDRKAFPRDKSCGDGLTPYAVRLLRELGIGPALDGAQRVSGVRIAMRGGRSRDFSYEALGGEFNYGLVVPRIELDEILRQLAIAAGAHFESGWGYHSLIWNDGRVAGAEFHLPNRKTCAVDASIVVGADGAASSLRGDAGLMLGKSFGFAMRGYFDCPRADQNMLTLALPLTDTTNSYVLPSYGWVFPAGRGIVNLGVGLFEDLPQENVRDLFRRFVADATREGGLAPGGIARGKPLGAPLRFDFSPEQSAGRGVLLVGDAAGLISPFTGEGISYALESARLAAEAITRCLETSGRLDLAEDEYRFLLGHKFAGYFEAGRKSARRYQLVWHVIESTFDSDRPIYSALRRLVLVPEGAGSLAQQKIAEDLTPLLRGGGHRLEDRLFKVGTRLASSLRRDWPFLSKLELEGRAPGAVVFRPSLLFFAAACLGSAPEDALVDAASALDLSYLAMFAQGGIEEDHATHDGANWGNKFSVLLSDFLLARAFELSSHLDRAASTQMLQSFESAHVGHLRLLDRAWDVTLSRGEYLRHLQRKYAPLFALPCTLAATLVGAGETVPALTRYGSALSVSYVLTEDVLALADPSGVANSALGTEHAAGLVSLPVIAALQTRSAASARIREMYMSRRIDVEELRRAVLECEVIDGVHATASRWAARATREAELLDRNVGTRLLARLAQFSSARFREIGANKIPTLNRVGVPRPSRS